MNTLGREKERKKKHKVVLIGTTVHFEKNGTLTLNIQVPSPVLTRTLLCKKMDGVLDLNKLLCNENNNNDTRELFLRRVKISYAVLNKLRIYVVLYFYC